MNPPFRTEEFLAVFAAYNMAIWPLQIATYAAGLLAAPALWLKVRGGSCLISIVVPLVRTS